MWYRFQFSSDRADGRRAYTASRCRYRVMYPAIRLRIRMRRTVPQERMTMEESLVNVEFLKSSNNFIARIQSELGGMREYRSSSFEEVLEQVVIDLQEEFESY